MKLLFPVQGYSCMLLALEIAGSRPAADLDEAVIILSEILSFWFFFFPEGWQPEFFFCLRPKNLPFSDLPSSSPEPYAHKKMDFWKSGCFPKAFNSTEDVKYCTYSGKPTISGMKIPFINDWAPETVRVIKILYRTELKILTGLSVKHCLKDVLALDSSSNIVCRHHSEFLLGVIGGR